MLSSFPLSTLTIVKSLLIIIIITLVILTNQSQQQQQLASPCPRAIKIGTNHQFRGSLHFICLQATNYRPRLEVIEANNSKLLVTIEVDELGTNQLVSFVDDEGNLRVLLAVPNRVNGTSMYSINRFGNFIEEHHTINTQYVSAMTLWKLDLNLEWHMAIANQPTYEMLINGNGANNIRIPLPEPKPIISMHSWRSTYFDEYTHFELPHDGRVNKLEPANINGQEFLIVALGSHAYDRNLAASSTAQTDLLNSLVYKLDFSDGKLDWIFYQNLNTKHAVDIKSFVVIHKNTLQRDYYFALLGQTSKSIQKRNVTKARGLFDEDDDNELIIYKYFGDKFMQIQSFPAPEATKLDAISHGQGDSYVIIALLSDWSNQISLYLFDGFILKRIQSPQENAPLPPPQIFNSSRQRRTMDLPDLHLFQSRDTGVEVVFGENLYQIPVQEIIKEHTEESSDTNHIKRNLLSAGQDLLGWCKNKLTVLLNDNYEAAAQNLLNLPRVDQPKPIEVLGDLIIDDDLHLSNLLYVNRIEERSNMQTVILDQEPSNFSSIFEQVTQTHNEIDKLKGQIDQILVDDGSIQDIYNPLTFERLVVECFGPTNLDPRLQMTPFASMSCPYVEDIKTNVLNSRDISNIQAQALLTGRSLTINTDVRFEHLVLRGSVDILNTLNGLQINDIVFKRGPSTSPIVGPKIFLGGLFSSSNLYVGSWNGLIVDRQNYLTSTGEQRIDAHLRFSNIIIDSNIIPVNLSSSARIEILNGQHLDSLLNSITTGNGVNRFSDHIEFDELILNGDVYFPPSARLSSIDLENAWSFAMLKQSNQNITGEIEFTDDVRISYGGELFVNGPINGIYMNPNNVLMRDANYVFTNPIFFEDSVVIRDLHLVKELNGIQIYPGEFQRPELAILYDGGTQMISGDKVLGDVFLGGYSSINGNINGFLNLTHLYYLATKGGSPFRFTKVSLAGSQIGFENNTDVAISSFINGYSTNDICSFANQVASPNFLPQYNRLVFERPIYLKSVRCATINGFTDLSRSFLTRMGNQRIAGTLRLVGGVVFNTSVEIRSTLNNMNVAPLARSIAQAVNESRTRHKEIMGDLVVDELIVNQINHLRLDNVFYTNSDVPQVVKAPLKFDHLDIENVLIIGRDVFTDSFNGLNMTDIISNTLQYDAPQIIYNHVQVNTMEILPNVNLATNTLNGYNLKQLYQDSVLNDLPQQILAPKTFLGPVEFVNRVFMKNSIDDLNHDELRINLLLHSDEIIEGDLEFINDVIVKKELEIQSRFINEIDVGQFVDSLLHENRQDKAGMRVIGNGSVRFKDVKLNNLVVAGTIQGIDLSRDAITKAENTNATYNLKLMEQQALVNNGRLIEAFFPSGSLIKVSSTYRGQNLIGQCKVHSCLRKTSPISYVQNFYPNITPNPLPVSYPVWKPSWNQVIQPIQQSLQQPMSQQIQEPILHPTQQPVLNQMQQQVQHPTLRPLFLPFQNSSQQQIQQPMQQPIQLFTQSVQPAQQFTHSVQSVNQFTHSMHPILQLTQSIQPMQQFSPSIQPMQQFSPSIQPMQQFTQSVQPIQQYIPSIQQYTQSIQPNQSVGKVESQSRMMSGIPIPDSKAEIFAQELKELTLRINKYLSFSFYYEIFQKHPLLGPLLQATKNPIDLANSLLMLKATSGAGEPCRRKGQKVAIMAPQPTMFSQTSLIQETSDPMGITSVIVRINQKLIHYMFILDNLGGMRSRVLIYMWRQELGMYQLHYSIAVDAVPVAMKAFAINSIACVTLVNPNLIYKKINGGPWLHCQDKPLGGFNQTNVLPLTGVYDMDVITVPYTDQFITASLLRHNTEQIGELSIDVYDMESKELVNIAKRHLIRPLKLHFVRNNVELSPNYQLVVSEAITSNDDALSMTRIYALKILSLHRASNHVNSTYFYETQALSDNQFYDIQSVPMNNLNSMLFLQSANSISVYAPSFTGNNSACDSQYSLVQRVPTKGSNKFLVFNDRLNATNSINNNTLFGHFLVLSKDDCDHQQYTTLILKAKFK